jgi:predicted deacetylase
MPKYFFRVDDIHPRMERGRFNKLKDLFLKNQIKPILAVIPDNQDQSLNKGRDDFNFWEEIKELQNKGWTLAVHGYQHKSINKDGGMINIHNESEFVGLSYGEQLEKIKKGKEMLESKGIKTDIFVAPFHSFDENTLMAIKQANFKYIYDGIALWPFRKYGLIWIPQIAWVPKKTPFGIISFCLHPQSFSDKRIRKLETFIKENKNEIVNLEWVLKWYQEQSFLKRIIFELINIIFRPLWYLRFNVLKAINK